MEGYGPTTYGERWHQIYDQHYPTADPDMIDRLTEFAGDGSVLELAIGSGRVALALLERGVELTGVDISEDMVALLRRRPGGDRIPVVIGDFGSVPVEGTFRLIYLVFNTLFALLTQEEQIQCFERVAARLEPGGRFVVEAFVPDPNRYERGQKVSLMDMDLNSAHLEISRHNRALQRVDSQSVEISERGTRLHPVAIRYAWPSEMDLMGRLAGLELEVRWGGWDRAPFDELSEHHISVYRLSTP